MSLLCTHLSYKLPPVDPTIPYRTMFKHVDFVFFFFDIDFLFISDCIPVQSDQFDDLELIKMERVLFPNGYPNTWLVFPPCNKYTFAVQNM